MGGLVNIQTHKYKPGVYTPLDNLINSTWLRLTNLLPMWFAPNLVTFTGFLPMAASYVLSWQYQPDFATAVPSWVAFYTGFSMLLYQTFDAMDGKQARRTDSASPIGQLFDHGCDCLACLSHHSVAAMVFLPGSSRWGFYGFSALFTGFFLAQWQEHYTGILCTSFGPVGVTETQYGLMSLAVFAGWLGPEQVAKTFAGTTVSVPWSYTPLPIGILCIQCWVVFVMVLSSISIYSTIKEAYSSGRLSTCLMELLPIIALNLAFEAWNLESYALAPRLVCFIAGVLFFYYTAQMILFSMAKMAFPIWQCTLVPFVAVAVYSNSATQDQALRSFETFAIAVMMWVLLWLSKCINQLKRHLGINIFTIKVNKTA